MDVGCYLELNQNMILSKQVPFPGRPNFVAVCTCDSKFQLSFKKAIFIFMDNVLPTTGNLFVLPSLFMYVALHFCVWLLQVQLCLPNMKKRRMKMGFFMSLTAERTLLDFGH